MFPFREYSYLDSATPIFGLFDRLHGQEVYPGTGIGLALAKESIGWRRDRAGIDSGNRYPILGKITQLRVLKREVRQPIA
ncbi:MULTISPECIES: hypothetical protein [unclassified Microcoleus]|uniref:hypothetical protein n=1 Tax=unclassified Microcoleus TaxID=2642155 RepID=UPI002FD4155F